jgi:hypothetical protein
MDDQSVAPAVRRSIATQIRSSGYQVVKLEPVAARVLGGGTSSVLPGWNVSGWRLPPGAILVSSQEERTSR